jgi:hypothetical protein
LKRKQFTEMGIECEICGAKLKSPWIRVSYRDKKGKWRSVCAGHQGTKEYSAWVGKYLFKELNEQSRKRTK